MGSGFLHGIVRERLTAEQVADAVGLLPVTGSGRIEVFAGRGGTALGFREGPARITDVRPAVVANAGPKAEADFPDERYWTQAWRPAAGGRDAAVQIQPDRANYPDDWWVPATNLAEWHAGTHSLETDGSRLVMLFRLLDRADNERFVFSETARSFRFGKLKTAWPEFADHNKVTLTRCKSASDATVLTDSAGTPLPDITAYIQTPLAGTPPFFAVNVGDVLVYIPDPDGNNLLIHAPMPGSNNLYDLPQITAIVHGKGIGGCGPLKAQ